MAGGHMPLRTDLSIDGVFTPRTSDWFVKEERKLEKAGENLRTINGELITVVLPGFQKYVLTWNCAGVRRHPAFDGLFIGRTALIMPIKELEVAFAPGVTQVTTSRGIVPGSLRVRDDSDNSLLINDTEYSVVGRTITLTNPHASTITGSFKWTSTFKLDDLDADWDEHIKEGGWNMTWREV